MEGKPDMPPNSQPTNPEGSEAKPISAENKRAADIKFLEENGSLSVDIRRVLEDIKQQGGSPQEKSGIFEIASALNELTEPSPFAKPEVKVPAEVESFMSTAENITKGRRREANLPKGIEVYNLNPVNIATVTDPELKLIGQRINDSLRVGTMDYQRMKEIIPAIEAARKNLPAGSPDRAWAENLYDQIDQEMVALRQASGEVDWSRVKTEMMDATRTGDLKRIEEIVSKYYDSNEHINLRDLVDASLSEEAIASGVYGHAIEHWLESIINVADLTPLGTIPNPTFVQSENISRLIIGTRDRDKDVNKNFYKYIKDLQERRQLSHELYKAMSTRGAYQKYVGENLKNDGFDYLENKIAGVSAIQGLWEKAMGTRVSETHKVMSQKEFNEIHDEVKGMFERHARLDANGNSQKLKKTFKIHVLNNRGQLQERAISRPLRGWELDRAAVVGRVIAHITGRAVTYGTFGDLPERPDELYDSLNAEYVARITAARKVLGARFASSSASKAWLKSWVGNKKTIAAEKGQIFGEGEKTLYGQKIEEWVYLDTSVPDLMSHSWRATRTQLMNSKYAKMEANGIRTTIGDYLAEESLKVDKLKGDSLTNELHALGPLTNEEQEYLNDKKTIRLIKSAREKNIIYSRRVREKVLQQRLYLSAISRDGHFTPMLKEEVWNKVSEFLPSRIAAFFPDERRNLLANSALTEAEWKALVPKLFMAEMDRKEKQMELVEGNNFATEARLLDYYVDNGITDPREIQFIDSIMQLGRTKSKMLAKMVFSQSAFLDDVPEPEWMNLGKETVGRLLVNDYEGYDTANKESGDIIVNPSMRLAQSVEHLVKAKDGYAAPLGVDDAQDRLEADIMTRYDLYAMDSSAKWGLYSIKKWLRKPTSPIEKRNIDAAISMDEKAILDDLDFLAQHSVVNSDSEKLDLLGQTELDRLRRKKKADLKSIWLANLRLFMMIFPAAFSLELIKMIAPDFVQGK